MYIFNILFEIPKYKRPDDIFESWDLGGEWEMRKMKEKEGRGLIG